MRHRYVVCYDISEPKRLARAHKKMLGYGDPLQYSVFCCDLSDEEKLLMEAALLGVINQREDRVMLVNLGPVGGRGAQSIEFMGRYPELPERRSAVIV